MTEAELQPLVTRCPDCATQFKVSEAQLQVANGKVRCGSCLAVFEGVDNLVWDSDFDADESADVTLDDLLDQLEDKPATAKPEPESETEVTASAPAEIDKVADLDAQSAPQLEPESEPEAQDQVLGAQTSTSTEVDVEVEVDPELVAEKIIQAANARTEPSVDFAVEFIEVPAEDTLLDLGSNYVGPDYASLNRTPGQHQEQQRRSRNRREAMAEMRALAAQREAEDAAAPIDETRIADTPASVPAVTEADLPTASTVASSTGAYARSEQLEQVWERKPQAASETQSETQGETQPEEVAGELATTGVAARVRNWRIPLVVGALVLLVAQVMYLQFDDWAVDPTFRPAYAAACGVLPCDLPDRRDLGLLKSRALKVRSHPQEEGALLVDALIVNEADFDQPFPELHLKFSSVEGNRLASERFSPEDYLAGDMAGAKMMPARTPVHIEVQAIDPGPNAVSYTLDFE